MTMKGTSHVGKFLYNAGEFSFDMDDRVLAHLRVVFMNKLRRNEPFMFQIPDANVGSRSMWVHAAIPISFAFSGGRNPAIDTRWIDHLMHEASGPNGLTYEAAPTSAAAESATTRG
jgi:hypothetical protein